MPEKKQLRCAVLTTDRMLFQKIRLELYGICDVEIITEGSVSEYDLYFTDLDSYTGTARGYTMTRRENTKCDIPLPFLLGRVRSVAEEAARGGLRLDFNERTAILRGRTAKLTEVEFSLLHALYRRRGAYACREELLFEVWRGSADAGVLNVYIHYLREKLEGQGEKIIISSRNHGYKIDEKYFGEVSTC